eukprot:3348696-Pyramimonas_sp.AAC.1
MGGDAPGPFPPLVDRSATPAAPPCSCPLRSIPPGRSPSPPPAPNSEAPPPPAPPPAAAADTRTTPPL